MARSHRRRTPMTPRGRRVAAIATVTAVVGGTFAYFALFPESAPAFVRTTLATVGLADEAPPPAPTCPLTGEEIGAAAHRSALAVKVENAPEARPQAGLNDADVVVEEPVEGGYTRFIAVYQCGTSDRVGPVRSGRTTDPNYLRQLGNVAFGYAGGVPSVQRDVSRAGLVDVNYVVAADAYTRDDSRLAPHNLYTTTAALWRAAKTPAHPPVPLFTYARQLEGGAKHIRSANVPYSSVSDVSWTWSRRHDAWLRSHGGVPHTLEDGERVSAANVVIQVVRVSDSSILDAAGNPSPEVDQVGHGRAFVLRDGRLIAARWDRPSLDEKTTFTTRDGEGVALAPGRTWVELVPSTVAVSFDR
jgi:Protein of unknown function (DUF3048) N-terminal domain/Protein of unknown function (DUF3048) C-terminal domain